MATTPERDLLYHPHCRPPADRPGDRQDGPTSSAESAGLRGPTMTTAPAHGLYGRWHITPTARLDYAALRERRTGVRLTAAEAIAELAALSELYIDRAARLAHEDRYQLKGAGPLRDVALTIDPPGRDEPPDALPALVSVRERRSKRVAPEAWAAYLACGSQRPDA